jgi:diguanylate cyclase (GGDEF)-like protein
MQDAARTAALALAAEELGACDAFVFRRIAGGRLVHIGGTGRGEGWAGIVEIGEDEATVVQQAVATARPASISSPDPRNIFGPYYARSAVAVPLPPDTIVVFGHGTHALPQRSEEQLRSGAQRASELIEHVSPAKRLADQLEVLEALRALADCPADGLPETLQHVVETAAEALSCELGVLYLEQPERIALANRGWPVDGDADLVLASMRVLASRSADFPVCAQDAAEGPLPAPFAPEAGIRSYYLLQLGPAAQGVLLLMHTDAAPRGFTSLCRELGARLVDAADGIVAAAVQRTQLRLEIERLNAAARRDPLTGLANRLAWDEAVADAELRCDLGEPASIVLLDLDDLKRANDELGHARGDELLRALATVVRASVRSRDTVARLGGDEIGVLLPGADERVCTDVVTRIVAAIDAHGGVAAMPLSAAIGRATCEPGGSLAATFDAADRGMYAGKTARHGRLSA